MGIDRLQGWLGFEHHISGILGLHNAPTILEFKLADHRTVLLRQLIQFAVQVFNVQLGRQLVGLLKIGKVEKGIVGQFKPQPGLVQFGRQGIVAVEVEL